MRAKRLNQGTPVKGMNKHELEAREAIANHIFTDEINKIGVSFSIETCLALSDEILSIRTEEWNIVVCSTREGGI